MKKASLKKLRPLIMIGVIVIVVVVNILVGGEPRRVPYASIVAAARDYIRSVGGFESFAAWGLV